MRLNRKGYMLVEIIVAFALAFSMAIYLLNLTIKFKDTNDDIYYSARYLKDKNLIVRNIMEDLEKSESMYAEITKQQEEELHYEINFELYIDKMFENRKLKIKKNEKGRVYIEYGKTESDNFVKSDSSYYKKELEQSLLVKKPEIKVIDDYISIKIPIESLYTDEKFDITLFSPTEVVYLYEVPIGSYVDYKEISIGVDECSNPYIEAFNLPKGWRLAYVIDKIPYIISAGYSECINSNEESSDQDWEYLVLHYEAVNNATNYCNSTYAYDGVCNNAIASISMGGIAVDRSVATVWPMETTDWEEILRSSGNEINADACVLGSAVEECIGGNGYIVNGSSNLIKNGGSYWVFPEHDNSMFAIRTWQEYGGTNYGFSWGIPKLEYDFGVRYVNKLSSEIVVRGGSGTGDDPYILKNINNA